MTEDFAVWVLDGLSKLIAWIMVGLALGLVTAQVVMFIAGRV